MVCGKPVIFGEKFCLSCIFKKDCFDQLSEKLRSFIRKLDLVQCNGIFLLSAKYGFLLGYDGEFHLKGMFVINIDEEDESKYFQTRKPTDKEKKLAMRLGIKLDESIAKELNFNGYYAIDINHNLV